MSKLYKTKQKELILNIIKKQKEEFTIKDIYNDIKEDVGLTTIYRLIDKLSNDGVLSKTIGKDNITYYQYLEECNEENHFFLKCEKCKKLWHVDCECIDDLSNHIQKKHNFITDKNNIVINGLCDKCSNKE